jgi:hypothetical protein
VPSLIDLGRCKDFLRECSEAIDIKELVDSTSQRLVIISSRDKAESAVTLFTSLLKLDFVVKWRETYEEVSFKELLEDAKLLALPTLWEMPEGVVVMRHTLITVKLRRLFMFLSAPSCAAW